MTGDQDLLATWAPLFCICLFTGMMLLHELGRHLGVRRRARDVEGARLGLGPVVDMTTPTRAPANTTFSFSRDQAREKLQQTEAAASDPRRDRRKKAKPMAPSRDQKMALRLAPAIVTALCLGIACSSPAPSVQGSSSAPATSAAASGPRDALRRGATGHRGRPSHRSLFARID